MTTPDNWRTSSYSGGGDGNECVEIANSPTHVAVRDTKTPAKATLTFPAGAFTTFVNALKDTPDNWRKSSYSGGGQGDACVEIAAHPTHIAVRDSKAPARATLTIPTAAFLPFLDALKSPHSTVTDFARFRG